MSAPERPPTHPEDYGPLQAFTDLEIALYGKSGNTWERGHAERVMRVLRKLAALPTPPEEPPT
jgi:hypothetical protein